jgi:hypothetical protein
MAIRDSILGLFGLEHLFLDGVMFFLVYLEFGWTKG